jgi:predicted nucleotidyltransferase
MIKNIDNIITQSIGQIEWILKEFGKKAVELEDSGKLTVNAIKSSALETIKALIQIVLQMTGRILSNVVREEINRYCSCGKKMIVSGRGVKTKILSMFGYISCYTPFLLTQV